MLKVSIIIPAYNTVDVINRTLKSVESQTNKNYELVIINDGSTDGTRELLDNYKKGKNNVIVHHQENQGVSAARNKGIELSNGEYICFLDSDDTYDCTFLEKMIKRQNETDYDVIYCGFNRIDEFFKNIPVSKNYYEGLIINDFLKCQKYLPYLFHLSCMIINKNLIIKNKINFEVGRKVSEDIFFIIKVIQNNKIVSVKERLFNYYYRENSTLNNKSIKVRTENIVSDYTGWELIRSSLDTKICNLNTINYVEDYILKLYTSYLFELLKNFKFDEIQYFNEIKNFSIKFKNFNKNNFNKSELKKIKAISCESKFNLFFWAIYYKFFRFNFKQFKKNKAH